MMRASLMMSLSLFAITLAGCGSGEPSAPVSSSPTVQSPVALNEAPATDTSTTPDDAAPLDAALVTLHLPGMT